MHNITIIFRKKHMSPIFERVKSNSIPDNLFKHFISIDISHRNISYVVQIFHQNGRIICAKPAARKNLSARTS